MKKYVIILLIALLACEDDKKAAERQVDENELSSDTMSPGNIQKERAAVQTEKEEPRIASYNGNYRKMVDDKPATDCNCNCIDLSFDGPTELCIIKDKVYITARCEKTGANTANLYLVEPARVVDSDRPLPWEDFDTDTPIASIEFQPDGTAELDWIGFSTDGKIATDYAIYGKKTLEGTYSKD